MSGLGCLPERTRLQGLDRFLGGSFERRWKVDQQHVFWFLIKKFFEWPIPQNFQLLTSLRISACKPPCDQLSHTPPGGLLNRLEKWWNLCVSWWSRTCKISSAELGGKKDEKAEIPCDTHTFRSSKRKVEKWWHQNWLEIIFREICSRRKSDWRGDSHEVRDTD